MIEVIPAIDIIEGRCVRLSKGDYDTKTVYDADPADMARRYVDCGLKRIHVVDLDGARNGHPANLPVLEKLASVPGTEIEWGGGLKTYSDLTDAFNAGMTYAVVGSVAARQPQLFIEWLHRFSPAKIVLGADVRNGKIAVAGWMEEENKSIDDLLNLFKHEGLNQTIVTDISCDGMLQGPAFELYTDLQSRYPEIDFTVSGGVSSLADIEKADNFGLRRIIVGKAIYEGRIVLKDIERLFTLG